MTELPATPTQADLAGFLASELAGAVGAYDEVFAAPGEPRAHWRGFLEQIEPLGRDELHLRAENSRRTLREHGVSYVPMGDAQSIERPWELDVLPFILSAAEWRQIEAGVVQRAQLLNLILGDLFGTQRLVRNGFIPAPLVYANPGYLRACQAIAVPGGNYLHTYAMDLGRAPDGRWWVLADRTQTPTGMGFAQENRSVISRVLPEAMTALQPRSLAAMLRARDLALRGAARHNPDNPNIVLLTPGPRNEGYFEHAYLARLLGYTLVEGGDLTVRDRAVFLKTLDGLQRVDVILRRITDLFCDPLELRSDSLLGVPGLVEATRNGEVVVANPLGSGLIESPGFMPFLPGLSQHLLNEELQLPSIATWWCGQAREFQHVQENLTRLSVRPAFSLAGETMRPGQMTGARRAALWEQISLQPHEYVAQESLRLSRVPVLVGSRWQQQSLILRVFATFNGGTLTVMPGGLARLVNQEETSSPALGVGGGSKDVWVLPEADQREQEPVAVTLTSSGGRAPASLPSRTADNFFWLGRYTERLEHLARLARCVIGRLNSDFTQTGRAQATVLHQLLAEVGFIHPMSDQGGREELLAQVLGLWHESGKPHGARDLLQRIHLAAFAVRDRLSADTWRILNRLESDAHFRGGHLPLVHTASVLNTLVLDLAAFSGMEMENMTRGQGWTFLDFGRRLERGSGLVRLLAGALRCGADSELLWEPVLEIADSVMTHRRRYFGDLQPHNIMRLLLADANNPRALAFQLAKLESHAAGLPTGANPEGVQRVQQMVGELARRAREAPAAAAGGGGAAIPGLEAIAPGLNAISELMTQVFFSHILPRVN